MQKVPHSTRSDPVSQQLAKASPAKSEARSLKTGCSHYSLPLYLAGANLNTPICDGRSLRGTAHKKRTGRAWEPARQNKMELGTMGLN